MRFLPIIVAAFLAAVASRGHAAPLDELAAGAVHTVQSKFPDEKLKDDDVAVTVVDLRNPDAIRDGHFRGGEPIYPASVIKLFYLAATHRWLEDGRLKDSDELRRTLRDMIV